jgi:methionyl-tRNA formyltransferase
VLTVMLVASEAMGIHVLRLIVRSGHRLVAVLAAPPKSGYEGVNVPDVARGLGIPVWPAELVKRPTLAQTIRDEHVDLVINVHSLHVVCSEVLAAPGIGAFNVHPGPLPRYAGLNAPSWAIYHGETRHGVTVHWMGPEIDAGPVAYARPVDVEPGDTGLSLFVRCARAGEALLDELVRAAAADPRSIPRIEQDPAQRRYFGAGPPGDGRLAWTKPARDIVNFVRAADFRPLRSPWGHPRALMGGTEVGVASAQVTGSPTARPPGSIGRIGAHGVEVAAADEWVLVREVVRDGRLRPACELVPGAS